MREAKREEHGKWECKRSTCIIWVSVEDVCRREMLKVKVVVARRWKPVSHRDAESSAGSEQTAR